MRHRSAGISMVFIGTTLFSVSVLVNLGRIAYGDSAPLFLRFLAAEPTAFTRLILAVLVPVLLVRGEWSPRMETATIILGMAMVAVSTIGLVSFWHFQANSGVPVAAWLWIFPIVDTVGGTLVALGSFLEITGQPGSPSPVAFSETERS